MKFTLTILLMACLSASAQSTNTNTPPTITVATHIRPAPTNLPPGVELADKTNEPPTSILPPIDTNFVMAHLEWKIMQGGWQDAPNLHLEQASINSNLLASVVWKGKTNYLILESTPTGQSITRAYTVQEVKHYSQ